MARNPLIKASMREGTATAGPAWRKPTFALIAGWPFAQFRQVTGYDLCQDWRGEMEELIRRGWGRRGSDRFQLTAQGLRFADAAAQLFLR